MKQPRLPQMEFYPVTGARGELALLTRAALMAGLLVTALVGCSTTPKVYTQSRPGAAFSTYHTFALMPLPTASPTSDPGLMLRVSEPARKATVDALTAKGLTEVNHAQADLAINLKGQFLPKVKVTEYGYVAGPSYTRLGGYQGGNRYRGVDVDNYEERTLTIEVFDNHTKELTWVGWSKRNATAEVDVEKLQAAIRDILSELPAGSAAPKH